MKLSELLPGSPWVYAGILAAGLAVGGTGAWTLQGWRYGAEIAGMKQAAAEALAEAYRERDLLAGQIAEIDAAATAKLRESYEEIDRLGAAVAAGDRRLRVAATCVPSTATGSGVDPGTGAELTAAARQDYLALRRGIAQVTQQLEACQAILVEERATSPPAN